MFGVMGECITVFGVCTQAAKLEMAGLREAVTSGTRKMQVQIERSLVYDIYIFVGCDLGA